MGPELVRQRRTFPELAAVGLAGIEVDHQEHDAGARRKLRVVARDLELIVTGSSDYHGTRKQNHELGCNTTAPGGVGAAAESVGPGRQGREERRRLPEDFGKAGSSERQDQDRFSPGDAQGGDEAGPVRVVPCRRTTRRLPSNRATRCQRLAESYVVDAGRQSPFDDRRSIAPPLDPVPVVRGLSAACVG